MDEEFEDNVTSEAETVSDVNEFDTLAADDDGEVVEEAQADEAETSTEEVAESEQETAESEEPVTEEAAEISEEVTEEEPKNGDEEATPQTEVEELEPEKREEQMLQYEEFMGQAEALLAEQVYKISEEEVAAFEDNPQEMLPKFAARVHMQAMQAATVQVARLLPDLMEAVQQQREVSSSLEARFDETWPDLADKRETVLKIGQVYRQLHPDASADDFIRDVGAQAMVALGLHNQQSAEVREEPKPAPYRPAGVGAAGKPAVKKETNEFSILAEDID